MKHLRWLWVVLILVAAGWIGWRALIRKDADPKRPGRGRVAVEIEPVRRATLRDTGRFSGSLLPRSSFIVAPRIGGRLERLSVDIGDWVHRNDLIVELDSEEYEQQVRQAEAELDVARANETEARSALETARRDRDRVAVLRGQAIASESELDAASARFEVADARAQVTRSLVRQRKAGLESARIRLAYTRIHAAWEQDDAPRVVGERFVHEGAVLRANDPVVSILDIAHLTAVVYAIERDYPNIEVGQRARLFADAWPDVGFEGTVARVAPLVREASRQARVEIDVPNPDRRLRPGMFVRAEIEYAVLEDVCVIPLAALTQRNGVPGVFQPDPETGAARFVAVTAGIRDREQVHLIEPALSGSVVTLGRHLLNDGTEISVSERNAQGRGRAGEGLP